MHNMAKEPYSLKKNYEATCIDFNLVRESSRDVAKEKCKCPICHNLIFSPVTCSKCDNIVDKGCLNKWKMRSTSCPINGCASLTLKPNSIHLAIDTVKLKCKNSGCQEVIRLTDYYDHLKKCPFEDYKCNNIDCQFVGNLEQVKKHVIICPKGEKLCKYCNSRFSAKEISFHEDNCNLRKMSCKICNSNNITLNVFDDHLKKCVNLNQKVKCEFCKNSIIFDDFKDHARKCSGSQFIKCSYCEKNYAYDDFKEHIILCSRRDNKDKTIIAQPSDLSHVLPYPNLPRLVPVSYDMLRKKKKRSVDRRSFNSRYADKTKDDLIRICSTKSIVYSGKTKDELVESIYEALCFKKLGLTTLQKICETLSLKNYTSSKDKKEIIKAITSYLNRNGENVMKFIKSMQKAEESLFDSEESLNDSLISLLNRRK